MMLTVWRLDMTAPLQDVVLHLLRRFRRPESTNKLTVLTKTPKIGADEQRIKAGYTK